MQNAQYICTEHNQDTLIQNGKINSKMLALAREARGLSQAELAEAAGISRSNISRMEVDNLAVSEESISKINRILGFKESIYYANTEILPSPLYRRRDKVAAKTLMQIDALINLYRMNILKLMDAIQFAPPPLPTFTTSQYETPERCALQLRKHWNLDAGPVNELMPLLETKGILTVGVDFGTERVDSRSIFIEDKYPVIFYHKHLLSDRLRFTLAYELGHLIMHTRTELPVLSELSHECNGFAASFLMPEKDIKKDFKEAMSLELLAQLKKKWKASMHSLLYRAEDIGVIGDSQKRYMINQFNQLKIRRREPKELDLPIERSFLLRELITRYRTKQKFNLSQIAAFFHLTEPEFLERFN